MASLWPRLRKSSKGEVQFGLSEIEIPVYDTTGEIIDYRTVHPKEMKRLTACRLYLQVVTVADITDGSGRFVISKYMKGHKCTDRTSTWEWPSQLRPSAVAWN